MAKKLSQLEKAIADIDAQIATLNQARQIIVRQQAAAPKRKTKAEKPSAAARGMASQPVGQLS